MAESSSYCACVMCNVYAINLMNFRLNLIGWTKFDLINYEQDNVVYVVIVAATVW